MPTKIIKNKGLYRMTIIDNKGVNLCQFESVFVFAQKNAECCIGEQNK